MTLKAVLESLHAHMTVHTCTHTHTHTHTQAIYFSMKTPSEVEPPQAPIFVGPEFRQRGSLQGKDLEVILSTHPPLPVTAPCGRDLDR